MSSYYNPSKRLSEYAAALLSPYIKLENEEDGSVPPNTNQQNQNHTSSTPSSLSVGLWSGNVELNNVELRPEAFEQFLNQSSNDFDNNDNAIQIRWKVIHGSIDSVKIQIPWTSLLVGSAHSTSKCSKSSKGDSDGVTEGKKCPKDSNNQEVDGEEEEGCTTVQIKGVKLQLGYEVINNQHQQNMQKNESMGCEQQVESYIIQDKIREEKNRILQTAEKRLLAGLDPFPPSLMEGLQSIMTSSMQSALLHPKNDDGGSVITSNTQDSTSAIKSYRSRMENYLSSTIKSLLWKVFDSLSFSVAEVQVSVAGYSHYDKDFASILRRRRRKEMEGKSPEKKQQQKVKQDQQQSNSRQKKNVRRRDHRNIAAARSRHLLYRHSSSFHRLSTDSTIENYKEVEENVRQQSERGSINEDPSIWSREGQVELGITIDRFDFKPGPLSTIDDNDDDKVQTTDSIALKLIQFKGLGVFLRRKCPMISRDGGAWDEYCDVSSADGGHTGKTLIWNDRKDDDYIVLPTYIEGSCKVYRDISGSATTDSTLSKQKMETDVHSIGIVSNSKDTVTTRRRGKREKRKKIPSSNTKNVEPVVQTATKQHNNLSNTTPSTATLTTDKGTRRFGDNNTFTPPHRFELRLEMGHVRSSVSPRQLFLMHSVASSIERVKRGRPPTTIRDAQSYDKKEHERMIEEGTSVKQSIIDWEERIYREIPALRSKCIRRGPVKTLPGVVSSWWRYACLNIVNEIQDRKALLSKCSGDTKQSGREGNILSRIDAQRAWDWEKQSSVRREYIDLYLLSRQSLEEGQAPTTIPAADKAAVTAAIFRLEQMEDELRPERILLLKHVARAASIRLENGETSPADRHYTFTQTTNRRQTMDSSGDGNTLRMSSQEFEGSSSPSAIQPTTVVATRKLDEERPIQKKKSLSSGSIQKDNQSVLSFSAQLVLSGFSLAVSDFSCTEVTSDSEFEVDYRADDVSVLTGYSDEDEYKPLKKELGMKEYFDPSCRFWSTMRHGIRCEVPLLLLHIVDISIAVKDMNKKFSVGGISLQSSLGLGQQNRFCLGHIPSITNDSVDGAASTKDSVDESDTGDAVNDAPNQLGISGCLDNGCSAVKVGPVEIILDWDWLEQLFKFASANKDIQPSKSTVPLQSEDLLRKAMSENSSQTIISTTLECDRLSLTVPVQLSKNGNKFLVTTINHMNIKAGNLLDNTPIDLESNIPLLPSQDLVSISNFSNVNFFIQYCAK